MSPSMEKARIDHQILTPIFSGTEPDRNTLADYQIHLAAFFGISVPECLGRCVGTHPEKLWVKIPNYFCLSAYDSFEKQVLPVLLQHEMGVLGMKPLGDHFILASQTVTPLECQHYAMNLPTSVVITGCDALPILEQALQAARSFQPLSQAQVAELLAKTATVAEGGRYELYKTSHHFDGIYQNPQWLE